MNISKFFSKINIAIICSVFFFIYIVVLIISFASKEKIYAYEVKEGTLAQSNIYTGIIMRDEEIVTCKDTGFINYFAREGEHVGNGDLVYTIDESGVMDDILENDNSESNLSDEDLADMKSEIVDFASSFTNDSFQKSYDFIYSMDGMVLKLANLNLLDEINSNSSVSDLVKMGKSEHTGYVVYNIDGMESISENDLNPELFDMSKYEKTQLVNKSLLDKGDEAYKLITSENWNIAIELDKDTALELADEGYVEIKFLENQRTVWAEIKTIQSGDNYYGILTLNTGLISFVTNRFVDIELLTNSEKGLKIPLSSIVTKEFYIIPKEYVVDEGEENTFTFRRKIFLEDGTFSFENVTLEVYSEGEEGYYVDDTMLKAGDYLIKDDSMAEYPVSAKGQLQGVYNMNKGYADFRQIIILYQNDEYAIVKPNTTYGLNVYDYIVLDSKSVADDELLYE